MLQKTDLVSYRPITDEDKNFIYATWLRGLYYDKDSWFKNINKEIFMENYHKVIEKILYSPNAQVKIACLKNDPDVILGYSVTRIYPEVKVLDWVFVKSAWRKIGIAKGLVSEDVKAVTHLTTPGKSILKSKMPLVLYNPFI